MKMNYLLDLSFSMLLYPIYSHMDLRNVFLCWIIHSSRYTFEHGSAGARCAAAPCSSCSEGLGWVWLSSSGVHRTFSLEITASVSLQWYHENKIFWLLIIFKKKTRMFYIFILYFSVTIDFCFHLLEGFKDICDWKSILKQKYDVFWHQSV